MVHKFILSDVDRSLDDLKLKNPYLYNSWEKHLKEDRNAINYDSQNAPIKGEKDARKFYPAHVRRGEKTK